MRWLGCDPDAEIYDDGAIAIAAALEANSTIKVLDFFCELQFCFFRTLVVLDGPTLAGTPTRQPLSRRRGDGARQGQQSESRRGVGGALAMAAIMRR